MFRCRYPLSLFLVALLAFLGCDPVDPERDSANRLFRNKQVLALVEAAEHGDVPTIDCLVGQGVDVNARGKAGATPLLRALVASNKDGYLALLKHGADPNQHTVRGDTITHVAAEADSTYWLEQALKYSADPNSTNTGYPHCPGCTPIFYAIFKERTENVQVLIDAGANLDHVDDDGYTPLYCACEGADYDIIYALLKGGADYRLATSTRSNVIDHHFRGRKEEWALPEQRPWFRKVVAFLEEQGVDLSAM